jgi:hypothetical protein
MGLQINESKTKYMPITMLPRAGQSPITINNYTFETVEQFVYLGSMIHCDNNISVEIGRRIFAANRCYFGLVAQLRSRLLSRKTKVTLYKTLIRPVLTYASETWTLTKQDENRLDAFERKILRRIYGPIKDGEVWRRRNNAELYGLYQDVSVVKFIKINRLRWLGHLFRMDDLELPKRVLFSDPVGRRSVGRPKLRWLDDVVADCRALGQRNWKVAAGNREVWRDFLEATKTHQGL